MSRRGRHVLVAALMGALLLAGAVRVWRARGADVVEPHVPGTAAATRFDERETAPPGVRIRVQVLNTTGMSGLGRRAMLHLRARGFDVVELGNGSPARDSTVVLDVSGNADWAERLAAAMGNARVESRPDSSRYLDAIVLIGRSWRAPAEPLDP